MALQMAMFAPKSEWVPPAELPDIFSAPKIAIDVETRDPRRPAPGVLCWGDPHQAEPVSSRARERR